MNNTQVGEKFAEGAKKGHSMNMFIDGDTVYSYGYHFPIASRVEGRIYLWNRDGYSNSTAKHKNHVARALGDARLVEVSTEFIKDYAQFGHVSPEMGTNEIKTLGLIKEGYMMKFTRARKDEIKQSWLLQAKMTARDIESLKELQLYK